MNHLICNLNRIENNPLHHAHTHPLICIIKVSLDRSAGRPWQQKWDLFVYPITARQARNKPNQGTCEQLEHGMSATSSETRERHRLLQISYRGHDGHAPTGMHNWCEAARWHVIVYWKVSSRGSTSPAADWPLSPLYYEQAPVKVAHMVQVSWRPDMSCSIVECIYFDFHAASAFDSYHDCDCDCIHDTARIWCRRAGIINARAKRCGPQIFHHRVHTYT